MNVKEIRALESTRFCCVPRAFTSLKHVALGLAWATGDDRSHKHRQGTSTSDSRHLSREGDGRNTPHVGARRLTDEHVGTQSAVLRTENKSVRRWYAGRAYRYSLTVHLGARAAPEGVFLRVCEVCACCVL